MKTGTMGTIKRAETDRATRAVRAAPSPLLAVRGLTTVFPTRRGVVRAVDGVDLAVGAGEVVALVGESGCGKTVTAYSIMGLLPKPGRIVAGEIEFRGEDVRRKTPDELRRL